MKTMINESLKPMIRQLRDVKDQSIRDALCDSLMEMCDELISKGEKNASNTRNADDSVRL
jgi:hypothetical protein